MRRILLVLTAALATAAFVVPAAMATTYTATFDPAAAPTGTHVQAGTPTCTVGTDGLVTCSDYELAGVGNSNASATLVASYSATVQCRNRGGQIVDVKSQRTTAPTSTGNLNPKNGRLAVPGVTSGPVPTDAQFEASAKCPNGNWTKETLEDTQALTSFTYTLHFAGFQGNYITITGP